MKAQSTYEVYDPPVEIEIEHATSGATRRAECRGRHVRAGRLDVHYPMCGVYQFSVVTGEGLGEATGWRLTLDALRTVRRDPDYRPSYRLARAPKRTATADVGPKVDARQKELFR